MSENIDALVLIGYGARIVADVPHYVYEDTEQGLWYVNRGEQSWYDGSPITESDKTNLHATEVFLKLGRLTAGICQSEPISFIDNINTFKFATIDSIRGLSPLKNGETLDPPVKVGNYFSGYSEHGLPKLFDAMIAKYPSLTAELTAKWAIAQAIYAKRGTVLLPGFDIDELAVAVGDLNFDEIAPTDITGSSYNLGDLIRHTDVEAHLTPFPYYATLREQVNGAEILESALEDLTTLSQAVKS